jgi:hypothetical protein
MDITNSAGNVLFDFTSFFLSGAEAFAAARRSLDNTALWGYFLYTPKA